MSHFTFDNDLAEAAQCGPTKYQPVFRSSKGVLLGRFFRSKVFSLGDWYFEGRIGLVDFLLFGKRITKASLKKESSFVVKGYLYEECVCIIVDEGILV